MLLAIFGALAAGLAAHLLGLRDVPLFLEVELGIILVCCILEIVRQKSVRERCVICGSDVETHFLAASLPPSEWERRFNTRRREGPVCRVCTDLKPDRARRYPCLTKFDDLANPMRKCFECGRVMRTSFLEQYVVSTSSEERDPITGFVRARECDWICRFPQSKICEKLLRKCAKPMPTGERIRLF